MSDAIRRLNDSLTLALSEGLPRPEGKEDWVYRDLPQMRADFFDQLIEMIGGENIVWITRAFYERDDGTYHRGQMFVSPAGIERVRADVERRAATIQ